MLDRNLELQAFRELGEFLPNWALGGLNRANEPHRHYHAPWHLGRMWRIYRANFGEDLNMALAIAYHDAVYVPRVPKHSNEMESARLFLEEAVGNLSPKDIMEISSAIVASADHLNCRKENNRFHDIFLDLDLEPISSHYHSENSDLLRKEFSHIPPEVFEHGRIKFLEDLLSKPRIFSWFGESMGWEAGAREQIEVDLRSSFPKPV